MTVREARFGLIASITAWASERYVGGQLEHDAWARVLESMDALEKAAKESA